MNTHLRVRTSLGLGIALAAVLAASAAPAKAEDYVKSFPVAGRASVRVETNDGSVHVSTTDARQVEFRVEYEGFENGKNLHLDAHQEGDKAVLIARISGNWGFSWGHNSRRLHIEVRMPRDGDVQVQSGDGSIQAETINGNISLHTSDGSIRANTLSGTIDLNTHDGSITVDTLKGDIKLHSGDGSIEAHQLDGKVDADSGDGHIRIEGRFDALNVRTGDGSVNTRVGSGSKMATSWNIRTGDGSVDLTLPADFQTNIDASTGDGHISLGIPLTVEGTFSNSQIHGKMNGGGQQLTIHTGDGSIRLSKS